MKDDQKQQKVWKQSLENELQRLEQGVGKIVKVTDTILFIIYNSIPSERH